MGNFFSLFSGSTSNYRKILQEIAKLERGEQADLILIQNLLQEPGFDINERVDDFSLLDHATVAGSLEISQIIITTGRCVQFTIDQAFINTLHACVGSSPDRFNKLYAVCQYLLAQGVMFDPDFIPDTILGMLFKDFDVGLRLCELVLEYGADLNRCTIDDGSNLLSCAYNNLPREQAKRLMQLLLNYRINPDLTANVDSITPLMHVAAKGDFEITKMLVNYGADLAYPNVRGIIARNCEDSAIKHYLDEQMRIQYGETVTAFAISDQEVSINAHARFSERIAHISSNPQQEALIKAFSEAAIKGNNTEAKYILANGLDLNYQYATGGGDTLLHWRRLAENTDLGILLLESASNSNLINAYARTPLFYALNPSWAEALIQHGADVHHRDDEGNTPLHFAVNQAVAEVLLNYGADINAKNHRGESVLFAICREAYSTAHEQLINFLVAKGADLHAKTLIGETMLHCAARLSNSTVMKILLTHTININEVDIYGKTALHRLAQQEAITLLDILLNLGADPTIRCKLGKTSLDYSYKKEMQEYLMKAISNYEKAHSSIVSDTEEDGSAKRKKYRKAESVLLLTAGSASLVANEHCPVP